MGTRNYYHENILVTREIEDEFDYDCFIEDAQSLLSEKFPQGYKEDKWEGNGMRNFEGKIVYAIDIPHETYETGYFVYARVNIVIRGGYYSGANIDYVIEEDPEYQASKLKSTKTLDKKVEAVCRRLENELPKLGQQLRLLGTFSNGEGVYERV